MQEVLDVSLVALYTEWDIVNVMIWYGMAPKGLEPLTLCYMGLSHTIKLSIVTQKIFSFIISL